MENRRKQIFTICIGGIFLAAFLIVGNIPFFSAIQVIPNVPFTLQIMFIAMMGLMLGLRGGLLTFGALLALTACGLPMMSGGRGGVGVFLSPTGGYIIGWVVLIIVLGIYSDLRLAKLPREKLKFFSFRTLLVLLIGSVSMIAVYLVGTFGMILSGTSPWSAFWTLLWSNAVFLPFDILKIALAMLLSVFFFKRLKK